MAGKRRYRWQGPFLEALSRVPDVSAAADAARISRKTVYQLRNSDPEFAAAWDEALERSTDALVGEMYRRAVHGTEKPVFYQGEECGRIREFSDSLAMFLARAHRPGLYGEKVHQTISGPDGAPLRIEVAYPDDDPVDDPPASPGTAVDPSTHEAI